MISWVPLESNPNAMNLFLQQSGVPSNWKIHDVYGLDKELLSMIPQPVGALILLFPATGDFEKNGNPSVQDIFFMKQLVGNACGTIALLHAVGNSPIDLNDGLLKNFFELNKDKSPMERGRSLINGGELAKDLAQIHETCAKEGQTAAPDANAPVDLHFIAIVQKNGSIYELDGRKDGPVEHGKTTDETFIEDAANICKKFIEAAPNSLEFSVVALAGGSDRA